MKLRKGQTAFILMGAAALLLVGVTAASASEKKPAKSKAKPIPGTTEDDVVVIPPNAQGIPDGTKPPIIVLPPKNEVPSPFVPSTPPDEVYPDTGDKGPDYAAPAQPVDYKVEVGPATIDQPKTPFPFPTPEKPASQDELVSEVVDAFTQEVLPAGTKVSPLAVEETKPAQDPNGTVLLAHLLLGRETLNGWKDDFKEEVKVWQGKVGLKPDGLFGVVSVSRMAEEVGILPLVRYWAKSYPTKAKALSDYQQKIAGVASELRKFLPDAEYQILALGESVKREKAKTFSANPPANPTLAEVETINQALASKAKATGKKELTNV